MPNVCMKPLKVGLGSEVYAIKNSVSLEPLEVNK